MLDKSAIDAIVSLATASAKGSFITDPRGGGYIYVDNRGELVESEYLQTPRKYKCSTIDGICGVIEDMLDALPGTQIRVGVSNAGVHVHFDERGDRQDRAFLPFTRAPSYEWLRNRETHSQQGLAKCLYDDQRNLVWTLRTLFAGRCAPVDFLPTVRNLKFTANSEGNSRVGHGRETVDLSLEQQMVTSGDGAVRDITEDITVGTAVFRELEPLFAQEPEAMPTVNCAVYINTQEKSFAIMPTEGEVDRAEKAAVEAAIYRIRETVSSDRVKVWADTSMNI